MGRETLEEHVVEEKVEETEVLVCDDCGDVVGEVSDPDAQLVDVAVNPSVGDFPRFSSVDERILKNELEKRSTTSREHSVETVTTRYHADPRPKVFEEREEVVAIDDVFRSVRTAETDQRSLHPDVEADYHESVCVDCAEKRAGVPIDDVQLTDVTERSPGSNDSIHYSGKAYVLDYADKFTLAIASVFYGIAAQSYYVGDMGVTAVAVLMTLVLVGFAWGEAVDQAEYIRKRKR